MFRSCSAAGASLYEDAQAQAADGATEEATDSADGQEGESDEDVVEADYEIVDESKDESK